ncbi:MAG TPA: hypothetical protein VK480_07825 [Solirubrobacterales bacterium]|nr:hypothetical protein [Solirubrobacterales bacterium]
MPLEFKTVPEELLGVASAAGAWLTSRGYKVTAEKYEVGYPLAPTLHGKRSPTTAIIEVDGEVVESNMRQWAAFGKSRTTDTRVWCAVSESVKRTGRQDLLLKELGIGLLVVGNDQAQEMIAPKDLGVNVEMPDIDGLSPRLQKALGPVYDHFDRGEWREAFEEACLALEDAARKHLWKGIKAGRIVIQNEHGLKIEKLNKGDIDRLTMGGLASRFSRIVKQSQADRIIGDALKQVNPHRIDVAHHKTKSSGEAKLRRNVGAKMWLIFGALKEIESTP